MHTMPFIVVSEDNWFGPLLSRIIIYITIHHGDLRLVILLHWTEFIHYIFAPMDTRNAPPFGKPFIAQTGK